MNATTTRPVVIRGDRFEFWGPFEIAPHPFGVDEPGSRTFGVYAPGRVLTVV